MKFKDIIDGLLEGKKYKRNNLIGVRCNKATDLIEFFSPTSGEPFLDDQLLTVSDLMGDWKEIEEPKFQWLYRSEGKWWITDFITYAEASKFFDKHHLVCSDAKKLSDKE